VTRHGDDLPATCETRAAAFAAAVSGSDDGTTKKPDLSRRSDAETDGLTFALSLNDLGRLEGERIGVWSACPAKS